MFKIAKDCLENKELARYVIPGVQVGTEECKLLIIEFEANPQFKFRLLDDDKEVYYIGFSDDCDSERAFEPLDMFGAADGCTEIQYLNKRGKWETL